MVTYNRIREYSWNALGVARNIGSNAGDLASRGLSTARNGLILTAVLGIGASAMRR